MTPVPVKLMSVCLFTCGHFVSQNNQIMKCSAVGVATVHARLLTWWAEMWPVTSYIHSSHLGLHLNFLYD